MRRTPSYEILPLILLTASSLGCSREPKKQKQAPAVADAVTPPAETPAPPDTDAPATSGIEVIGGPALVQRLGATKSKATIVNIWASWCGPCRREFPMLTSMSENLRQSGVDVVFVSVDEPDSHGAALEFATQNGKSPPLLVAERPLGAFKRALSERWKGALPATFLFDAKGQLRYFWNGPVYDNELLPVVEGFLRGENIDGEAHLGLSPGRDMRQ